jgi:O-antigen/teichoic acid export membrane protein
LTDTPHIGEPQGGSGFVKNSAFGIVGGISLSLAGFASGVVVARTLGVDASGVIAMALWLLFLAVTVCDAGIPSTLARFLPDPDLPPDKRHDLPSRLLRPLWLAIVTGSCVLLAVLLSGMGSDPARYHLSPVEAATLVGLVVACFVVHMIYSFGYQYLRGSHQFGRIARLSLLGAVIQVLGVGTGGLLFGVSGAMAGYILGSLPVAFITMRMSWKTRRLDPVQRTRLQRYAWTIWLSGLLSPLLWTRADLLLVERGLGIHAAGLFTAAASLSALVLQLCMMLCSALLPHLSAVPQVDRARASAAALKLLLLILLPIAFGMAALAPRLVPFVYGPDFAAAGLAAYILSIAAGGSAITLVTSNVLNLLERNGRLVAGGIASAILTIVLCLWLIPLYGIIGAAFARLCAQGALAAVTIFQVNRLQPATISMRWFLPVLVSALLSAFAAELVMSLLPYDWAMLAAIVLAGVAYILFVMVLVPFEDSDVALLTDRARLRPAWIKRLLRVSLRYDRREPPEQALVSTP